MLSSGTAPGLVVCIALEDTGPKTSETRATCKRTIVNRRMAIGRAEQGQPSTRCDSLRATHCTRTLVPALPGRANLKRDPNYAVLEERMRRGG